LSAAPRFWIGVASRDHVHRGVAGGFCQLGHGKAAPIRRLAPGDWIAHYSPRESYPDGALLQAFTAIGEVSWGAAFRRGLVEVTADDFAHIAAAMGVTLPGRA